LTDVWYWRTNTHRRADSRGHRKDKSQLQYNWTEIDKKINQVLKQFKRQGFKPTARELNYALISLNAIPNLHKTYQSLDKHMVKGREELGTFPIDCLADDRHPIVDINDTYYTPEAWIDFYIGKLRNIAKTYVDDVESFPRWEGQKDYVEIWTEKQAMVKHFIYIVKKENLQVRTVPYGGFPGTTELNDRVIKLKEKMRAGKNIHILWFGDLDPSGESIDRTTFNKLTQVFRWRLQEFAKLYGVTFELERVAVTEQQIQEYDLPWNAERMSEEEQEKLQDDPRYKKHYEEHHGQPIACEVDSLPTIHPKEFRKIVVNAVNKHFKKKIHKDGLEKHEEKYPEQYTNDELVYRMRPFMDELEAEAERDRLEAQEQEEADQDEDQ
jgi:hypothetical protein